MGRVWICLWLLCPLACGFVLAGDADPPSTGSNSRQATPKSLHTIASSLPAVLESRQYDAMNRILDELTRNGASIKDALDDDRTRQGIARLFDAARKAAVNQHVSIGDRVAAVRILARGPDSQNKDLKLLAALLAPQCPLEVQFSAVDAMSRLPHQEVTQLLLSDWTKHGPRVHTAVVAVLLWREPWMGAMDPRSETDPELAAGLDWARHDIALRHPSADIRMRAENLLATRSATTPKVQDALDKFFPALTMRGDVTRGKKMFVEATCANCHKLDEVGRHVGPDLSRLVDKSPRTLLIDTVDPNRVVNHPYLEYTVLTTNGLQITGMLFDETSDCLTLADSNGEGKVILRKNLDEMVSTNRSQMPEGLEGKLALQQMADLIAFVAGSVAPGGDKATNTNAGDTFRSPDKN